MILNPQQLQLFGQVEAALEMLGFQLSLEAENKLIIKGAPELCP